MRGRMTSKQESLRQRHTDRNGWCFFAGERSSLTNIHTQSRPARCLASHSPALTLTDSAEASVCTALGRGGDGGWEWEGCAISEYKKCVYVCSSVTLIHVWKGYEAHPALREQTSKIKDHLFPENIKKSVSFSALCLSQSLFCLKMLTLWMLETFKHDSECGIGARV